MVIKFEGCPRQISRQEVRAPEGWIDRRPAPCGEFKHNVKTGRKEPMKIVRVYAGDDGESHVEIKNSDDLDYVERGGMRTTMEAATGVEFALRKEGDFADFHNAPRRQYVLYLTALVEIGLGDGSALRMEPGDVLLAEDTTGHGHSSRVLKGGTSVTVRLEPLP
jgi:hypothetical protein